MGQDMTKAIRIGRHTLIGTVSAHNIGETHRGFNVWRTHNLSVRQLAIGTLLFAVTHCTPVTR